MTADRLQKILARAGISSRRAAEQLVLEGRVRVNGEVVRELGAKADPARDRIEVDGRPVAREERAYFLVHKPRGMVTTLSDPEGRPSLSELLKGVGARVYPVGRLDFNTSGVLLVTNDGDLAQALLHPSKEVPKTYIAKLNGVAEDRNLESLKRGVTLDDGYQTAPARVTRLRDEEGHSWLEITITEGKNRQVHRMIEAVGFRVMRLSRVKFAGLTGEDLRPGEVRALDEDEIAELRRVYQGILPVVRVPKGPAKRADGAKRAESAGGRGKVAAGREERAGGREARAGERGGREARAGERGGREARAGERGGREARAGERGGREARAGERGGREARAGERGGRDARAGERGAARGREEGARGSRESREGSERGARASRDGVRAERPKAARENVRSSEEKSRTSFDKSPKPRHKRGPT